MGRHFVGGRGAGCSAGSMAWAIAGSSRLRPFSTLAVMRRQKMAASAAKTVKASARKNQFGAVLTAGALR